MLGDQNMNRLRWIAGSAAIAAVTAYASSGSWWQDPTVGWDPLPRLKTQPINGVRMTESAYVEYREAIRKTAGMVSDGNAQRLANKYGLNVLNLTWEDTGRYKNSSVGPNISDMTIQVGLQNPRSGDFEVTAMPVIRFPNFSDLTTDLDPRDFTLLVGNEKGRNLQRISLYDFIATPTQFLSNPREWKSSKKTLLAPRDSKVLVSAQACFLPVPKEGIATFNPVIFNYQSMPGDPAVLTILATREGTSVTVIDNQRDAWHTGSMWGQRLFFNKNGMRASFTGTRLSDFTGDPGRPFDPSKQDAAGMNMVLLIQIPLKQKRPMRELYDMAPSTAGAGGFAAAKSQERSNVEAAVIGHGDIEGPFTEIDNLAIERDDRFPVRVTVQFYKATSNGVVSEADVRQIRDEIKSVYDLGDVVGSLVTDGNTGRPTEYYGSKVQPRNWWDQFWRRYELSHGESRYDAIAKLQRLLGRNYMQRPVSELYLRDLLKK